ncbi:hypothetical protein C8Q74DRAFT_410932 [Fomes fomentarius]|nr:hypothetical protein C8Q74DRAFT_410932 [Fomes fomentarius]
MLSHSFLPSGPLGRFRNPFIAVVRYAYMHSANSTVYERSVVTSFTPASISKPVKRWCYSRLPYSLNVAPFIAFITPHQWFLEWGHDQSAFTPLLIRSFCEKIEHAVEPWVVDRDRKRGGASQVKTPERGKFTGEDSPVRLRFSTGIRRASPLQDGFTRSHERIDAERMTAGVAHLVILCHEAGSLPHIICGSRCVALHLTAHRPSSTSHRRPTPPGVL